LFVPNAMELFYRHYGSGPAIIIVHGLYGASDNWVSIAKALSDDFEVFILDQRNHGRSPHHPIHTYQAMTNDLLEFMDDKKIQQAILIGHSMGGKTVMHFAKDYPERVASLIVVDIAPVSYLETAMNRKHTINHFKLIQSMKSIDFSKVSSRAEVEEELMQKIGMERTVKFLMKNLHRVDSSHFEWSLNLDALDANLPAILDGLNENDFAKGRGITGFPVLFIKGENSDYISREVFNDIILTIFPYAELVNIPNAGHWVHAEQSELLIKNLKYFIHS
jgi:esterase